MKDLEGHEILWRGESIYHPLRVVCECGVYLGTLPTHGHESETDSLHRAIQAHHIDMGSRPWENSYTWWL